MAALLLAIVLAAGANAFDRAMTLDPAIPTVAPSSHDNPDICAGHCALSLVESINQQLGPDRAAALLQLNYQDFLRAFSNVTFFETFCGCQPGYLHEMLMRSSEVIDLYCTFNHQREYTVAWRNRSAIVEKFPCLAKIEPSMECLHSCTSHHGAVMGLMNNFRHIALNGDTSQAEKYISEGCEYVICSLHCEVPPIAHTCGFDTANLVIKLTRQSLEATEKLATDMGAVRQWPKMCADIKTYRLPQPSAAPNNDQIIAAAPVIPTPRPSESAPAPAPIVKNHDSVATMLAAILVAFATIML